jgi:hypothetical protein
MNLTWNEQPFKAGIEPAALRLLGLEARRHPRAARAAIIGPQQASPICSASCAPSSSEAPAAESRSTASSSSSTRSTSPTRTRQRSRPTRGRHAHATSSRPVSRALGSRRAGLRHPQPLRHALGLRRGRSPGTPTAAGRGRRGAFASHPTTPTPAQLAGRPRDGARRPGSAHRGDRHSRTLSGDEGVEQRIKRASSTSSRRASSSRSLRDVLRRLSVANAYERAPWIRALIVGCRGPWRGRPHPRRHVASFSEHGPHAEPRTTRTARSVPVGCRSTRSSGPSSCPRRSSCP